MAITGYRMFIDSGVYTPELNDDGVLTSTVIMPYHKGLINGSMRIQDVPYGTDVFGLSPMSPMPPLLGARECCGLGFCQKLLYQKILWGPTCVSLLFLLLFREVV
jgi:hypothetical protein